MRNYLLLTKHLVFGVFQLKCTLKLKFYFLLLISVSLLSSTLYAQQKEITGKVTDVNSQPLEGASVVIAGTKNGTITKKDGLFILPISNGGNIVLEVSIVGYQTRTIKIGKQTKINIKLEAKPAELSEVLITGYTAQSKRSVTGSIVSVKGSLIRETPVTNVQQALEGRVAGLTAISDGSPEGNVSIRIRGVGTLNGSDPLYIIDGVPTTGNLNQINPADIESISVLKDASAASIYGSRAANGVIIIETKKGKVNQKASVTFQSYIGSSSFPKKTWPKTLNTQQYANSIWESQRASGILNPSQPQFGNGAEPVIPDFISPVGAFNGDPNTTIDTYDLLNNQIIAANKAGTNWFDALTRSGISQNYNIGVNGGGPGSRYAFSAGYLNRQGAIIFTSFKRYDIRINTEFSVLNNRVRIGENLNFSYSNDFGTNPAYNIYQTLYTPPIMPVYDIKGNFAGTHGGALALGTNYPNGVADQTRHRHDVDRKLDMLGNAYIEVDILRDLTFKSSFGAQLGSSHSTAFYQFSPEVQSNGQRNDLTEATNWVRNLTWTNTLTYNKQLGINHHLTLFAGTEAIMIRSNGYSATRRDLYSSDLAFRYLIASSGEQKNGASIPSYSNLYSMFGKVDYSFKSKYYLNATLRRDGSSRFASENQYEVFPAFGAAWIASEESFLKDNSTLSSLKLRVGWGQTGNQGSAGDFSYAEQYGSNPTTTGYDLNATQNSILEGFTRTIRGNHNLTWESSTTLNIGADFSFFKDKFNFTIEWYNKDTRNMLASGTIPGTAGLVPPPLMNIGKIKNKGVDASLGYRDLFGDLSIDLIGTFSTYKNKIIDIDGNPNSFLIGGFGEQQGHSTRNQAGHPVSSFYGLIVDGVIQSGPDAGNFNFRDLNKDGVINDDDRTFIGTPHPDFQYSMNINLSYKNIGLTIFLIGTEGNKIFNFNKYYQDFDNRGNWNRGTNILHAWTPKNKNNTLAQYNSATAGENSRPSTYFIESGSYLRFQNVQLGYNITKIPAIKSLRIYIQAQNLFTFTKYTGVDPEIGRPWGDNLGFGVDNGDHFPINRTFLVGLNVGF